MTTLTDVLFDAIRDANGQWLTRAEIAQRIGRKRGLFARDAQLLDELVNDGKVEKRTGTRGVAGTRFEYRLKELQHG